MQRLIFTILFFIPVSLFSLNKKIWKKTPNGINYKIYTDDTTKSKPVYGDYIWMHLRKFSPKQKEIFNTRVFDVVNGVEMEYKKPIKKSDVTEIFSFMGKGDSAIVKIQSDVFDSNGSPKKYYTFWLNLISYKPKAEYESIKKERDKQQAISDSLLIQDYLISNNLQDAILDKYGNWYLRKQFGKGKLVNENDSLALHYTGKLSNGKEFDNSFDRKIPLSFVVGKKQVIDGLDKGIQNFYFGDKGILILPSRFGYSDREIGKIPPNSVLIFEIEVLE